MAHKILVTAQRPNSPSLFPFLISVLRTWALDFELGLGLGLVNLNINVNCNLQPTTQVVERTGVRRSDPRLQQMMTKLSKHHKKHGEENTTIENLNLDLQTFSK